MDIGQGKLVIGIDVNLNEKDSKFPISIYNVILGESATSKLFQNVREKESLAYTIRSNYVRQKNNIYIFIISPPPPPPPSKTGRKLTNILLGPNS
jgi:predicted Zn-dependent peptidase